MSDKKFEIINEADIKGTIDEFNLEPVSEEMFDKNILNPEAGRILKIYRDVYAHWTGVSSCCDQTRVNAEWSAAVSAWRGKLIDENRRHRYMTSYVPGGTAHCRQSDGGGWGGSGRRCSGSATVTGAYIEFWVEK